MDAQKTLRLAGNTASTAAIDRALKDAQMRLEGEVLALEAGPRRGALLALAGDVLRCRGKLEMLPAA